MTVAAWKAATSGAWGTATNWNPAAVPNANGDTATFFLFANVAVPTTHNIDLGSVTRILTTLNLASNANEGYSLNLGTINMQGASAAINVSAIGSVASVISAGLALTNNTTITTSGTAQLTQSGVVSGSGQLIKAGTGNLLLSNIANTWTGGANITAGTILAGAANAFGSAATAGAVAISAGASLDMRGSNQAIGQLSGAGAITSSLAGAITLTQTNNLTTTFSGSIQNGSATSLGFTKTGGGTLILSGVNNTYSGQTTITQGVLQAGATNTLSANSIAFVAGTLDLAGFSQTIGGLFSGAGQGLITNSGAAATLTFGAGGAYSGAIQGAIGLTKTGAGTQGLRGTGNYTGVTQINQGTLNAEVANALSAGSAVNIAAGAVLQFTGNQSISTLSGAGGISGTAGTLVQNNAADTMFSGVISGVSANLQKAGAGTLTLTGVNQYGGNTTLNAGILEINNNSGIGVNSSAQLIFAGGTALRASQSFVLNKSLTINAGFSAGIRAAAGTTLQYNATTATFNGGGTSSIHFGSVADTGTVNMNLVAVASGLTNNAIVVDGGVLQMNQNFIDAVASVNVAGGATLRLGTANANIATFASLTGTGLVTANGSTTTNLTINNASASAFAGNLANGTQLLRLTKQGAGTFTLSGVNTYTGFTDINGGTLRAGATNTLSANSLVRMGAGGTLDLAGFSQTISEIEGSAGSGITNSQASAAILTINDSSIRTFQGVISDGPGKVGLVKNGSGSLNLSGSNTYSGATIINSGGIGGQATNALGVGSDIFVAAGASLDFFGFNQTIGALSGAGQIDTTGGTVFQTNAGATTFSGTYNGGASSLVKNGAGTLTLSGAVNYSGSTTINAGVLALSGGASLFNSSSVTIGAGAGFDISGVAAPDANLISMTSAGSLVLGGKVLHLTNQAGAIGGTIVAGAGVDGLDITLSNTSSVFSLAGATFSNWNSATDTVNISVNPGGGDMSITGSAQADVINGGNGNDTLNGGAAGAGTFNQLNGGGGEDTASYAGTAGNVFADILNSNAGTINGVLIDVYTSIEHLIGGNGNDTLLANNDSNRLSGGLGDDLLFGQDGNDTLIGGGHVIGSFNQLFGGADIDTVDYSAETGRVFVDLRAPAGHIDNGLGFVLNDFMNSIENVLGGSNDDTLVGTDADNNLLVGNGGTDLLFGQDGNDTMFGGAATTGQYNQLFGGLGSDTASYEGTAFGVYADLNVFAGWVKNGVGTLVLTDVYNQVENLTGGSVADTLVGNTGANVFTGGAGADFLYANYDANNPTQRDAAIDTFVYSNSLESTLGSGFDQIINFTSGQDKIDLRALNINAGFVTLNNNLNGTWSIFADTDGVAGVTNNDLAILVQSSTFVMGDIMFT